MFEMQQALYEASQILERAISIVADAPFFTYVCEKDHASIVIDGETAILFWPEANSGYYNSCSIEAQSRSFPAVLLLMNAEQIAAWKIEERAKYDAEQKAKKERQAAADAIRREQNEREVYAALKAKFEPRKD